MRRKKVFIIITLVGFMLTGCVNPGNIFRVPKTPGTGGRVDNSDLSAPKEIKSKELTHFSNYFFLYGQYSYEKDAGYSFDVKKHEDGTVTIEEKACYHVSCETDGRILEDIQAIIDKYELAKRNGTNKHTAGLPPEFQPSSLLAEYESGESIYFSEDNNPNDPCEREILKLLGDEFSAHGENCFQPPAEASKITRFELDVTDGSMRYRYGEIEMAKEGVEKSFEDLVTHGYEEGEYFVAIEKDPWDRSGRTDPKTIYREVTPEYYEGLKKILDELEIINFVNDKQYPSDFDYEGTLDYYNFYIEYASGDTHYGFSSDTEENKTFAPVAKAIAEYIENFINEDPKER